jgi:potassium-dependent mechanosensitive channel
MQASTLRPEADRLLDLHLFRLAGTSVTLGTLLVSAIIVIAGAVLARLARTAIQRALTAREALDEGTARVAARLISYLVLAVGIGIALETLGVHLAAFFAAGAFLAVAVGLALQSVAQNLVSGVILLFERTIKPGDVLEVDGRVVRVTRMGLRATVARTRDEEDLIIPNSILAQQIVTNFTLLDSTVRVRSTVDVGYDSDLD